MAIRPRYSSTSTHHSVVDGKGHSRAWVGGDAPTLRCVVSAPAAYVGRRSQIAPSVAMSSVTWYAVG
jgi:hypothetical protein